MISHDSEERNTSVFQPTDGIEATIDCGNARRWIVKQVASMNDCIHALVNSDVDRGVESVCEVGTAEVLSVLTLVEMSITYVEYLCHKYNYLLGNSL